MIKFRPTLSALSRAFALCVLATAVTAVVPVAQAADTKEAKEPKCEVNKKFADKYKPAGEAAQKGDWATALSAAKEAYAEAKLPCEQMYAVQLERSAAYNLKNNEELLAAAALMNTVSTVTEKDKITNLQVIYQTLIQQKEFDKAIPALKDYIAASGASADSYDMLARLSYQQKDCAGAVDALSKVVAIQPASEQQLLMTQDCQYKAKNTAAQAAATEELLKRFPKENYMIGVLALYQDKDELQLLNLYRLAYSRGFLTRQGQIIEYAGLADRAGMPAEAQKVLEKAATEKWITLDDKNTKQLAAEKRNAAEDKKTLPALEKEAKASSSGKRDVAVGYTYFGFEDWANAVESIKRGLSAGRAADVKRADDANMVLGIALSRQGKYDDAAAAFAAAKTDARMAKAAELWTALMKP